MKITTPDGQTFTTRLTEKLKAAMQKVLPKKTEPIVDTRQMSHGAPLDPVNSPNTTNIGPVENKKG